MWKTVFNVYVIAYWSLFYGFRGILR